MNAPPRGVRWPTGARIEVLLGALAFAASVPAGKWLLSGLRPMALSGGLYLAGGLFCAAALALQPRRSGGARNRVHGREWWWLLSAIACGGILGPLALFYGLRLTSGHLAGLLLNFEAVFTVSLGAILSGERVGARGARGIGLILAGAVALSTMGEAATSATRALGPLLIIAACTCWGLDNNFTQRISLRDARQIVAIKGVVGGTTCLLMATWLGQLGHWSARTLVIVGFVGAVSYGLSIVLFIRGLRVLGIMHTGALFALAPGFAVVLSWIVLREPIHWVALLSLTGMTGGAWLLAMDVHEHEHTHEALEHAHEHEHDEHHRHEHTPEQMAQVPHAHGHWHEPLSHRHPHTHDVHHRHPHERRSEEGPRS